MANVLTVYYSRKGENYYAGSIRNLEKGNCEYAAEYIQEAVGGDLFKLETVQEYSEDYHECTNEAMDEKQQNARPKLKKIPESIDSYDTIFLVYPCWWGTCPMCVFTFLDAFDFTGKTVVPLCSNEGSGMGSSERDLRNITKTIVKKGLSVTGSATVSSKAKIQKWAKENVE